MCMYCIELKTIVFIKINKLRWAGSLNFGMVKSNIQVN